MTNDRPVTQNELLIHFQKRNLVYLGDFVFFFCHLVKEKNRF